MIANIDTPPPATDRVLRALDNAPGVLEARLEAPDRLVLRTRAGEQAFRPLPQRRVTRAQAPAIANRLLALGDDPPALLLTDRVDPALGELLREHGLAYLDAGGNAWIDRGPIAIWVDGRPPVTPAQAPARLTATVLRVLLVALRERGLADHTHRELAAAAGVALGAVGRALATLERRGLLRRTDARRFALADEAEAVRAFTAGWLETLRPKLAPRAWRAIDGGRDGGGATPELVERLAAADRDALLGGELAAARLTRFLTTDRATIHLRPGTEREVARALRLVPDPAGPIHTVHWLTNDGALDRQAPTDDAGGQAHPLLVLAELMTTPDERAAQTARVLEEAWLAREVG